MSLTFDRAKRVATLTVRGPDGPVESTPEAMLAAGDRFWPLRAFRELDDALLRLRVNEPVIGTIVLRTVGDPALVLRADAALGQYASHWFVREVIGMIRRTLKRLDLSARSFFALIDEGSAFAGTLVELALAADRSYILNEPDRPTAIQLSPMNSGRAADEQWLVAPRIAFLR